MEQRKQRKDIDRVQSELGLRRRYAGTKVTPERVHNDEPSDEESEEDQPKRKRKREPEADVAAAVRDVHFNVNIPGGSTVIERQKKESSSHKTKARAKKVHRISKPIEDPAGPHKATPKVCFLYCIFMYILIRYFF